MQSTWMSWWMEFVSWSQQLTVPMMLVLICILYHKLVFLMVRFLVIRQKIWNTRALEIKTRKFVLGTFDLFYCLTI